MRVMLPPYLSMRHPTGGLRLGTLPPLAFDIEEPPDFLPELLADLATPTDRTAVAERVVNAYGWTRAEADALLADLEGAGLLIPEIQRGDRYDRHRLYYRMLGLEEDAQARLGAATVGLIGMGGIGSALAVHLATAGVGRLVITDGDVVEESNLTRQVLYQQDDIGRPKVEAAPERLRALNPEVRVEAVARGFDGIDLARQVAAQSDIVLLSADRPPDVHVWAGTACREAGVPYSAAGYIEAFGSVGPLLHPPSTPCFDCVRLAAEALPGQPLQSEAVEATRRELNPGFQAPSYGPLNALAATIQANEAIRWLLGLPVATAARRVMIDSVTYGVTWEVFETARPCESCRGRASGGGWGRIADQYRDEREEHSFNAVLLDDLVPTLLPDVEGLLVAASALAPAQMSEALLRAGARVQAYEPDAAMATMLAPRLRPYGGSAQVVPAGLEALRARPGRYEALVCLNVLDHVPDLDAAVDALVASLKPGGAAVVSVPHPFKDRGGWRKSLADDGWRYDHFIADDYFDEGPCVKVREDRRGEVRLTGVTTQHRTVSTYYQSLARAGLQITGLLEPEPGSDVVRTDPVLYSKASRMPYFLVITGRRAT